MTLGTLPRLANLIALRSSDAASRERFAARLRARAGYRVHTPAALWIVGVRDIPGSDSPDARDEADGCFLAEGQRTLPREDGARAQARAWLHGSAERAATSSEDVEDQTFLSVRPDGSAVFQRSLGGRVPCYWWARGEDLVLATDSSDLIRIGEHDGRPDALITALCLSGSYNNDLDGRAHLFGAHKLNKAQGLCIDAACRVRRYEHWQPIAFEALKWPTHARRQERLQRFRETLLAPLAESLTPTGRNLLSLSGGVDSSLLLALAVGRLQKPVASVSIVPAPDDGSFAREADRIAWLRGLFPTAPHLSFELFSQTQFDLWNRLRPAAIPMFNPHMIGLQLLQGVDAPHVSFGGEEADEVCGSNNFTLADWMLHAPQHAWRLMPSDVPRAIKRVDLVERSSLKERMVRWKLPLRGRLESWIHRDLHREWDAMRPQLASEFRASIDQVANPFFWAIHRGLEWQPMHWEWCGAQGVHRLSPFSTSRILALALASHPAERLGKQDKRLSRRAFEHDFPPELLGRVDKGSHEKVTQYRATAAEWQNCLNALPAHWSALADGAWTSERDIKPWLNEPEGLSNLLRLLDLPKRLAFFSTSIHQIREGHDERASEERTTRRNGTTRVP